MSNVRIGILGGIGPEATGRFYLRLIEKLQGSGLVTRNEDFPKIFINSIPAPELISETITLEMLEPYRLGLQELDTFKVDFIVMVCNTIHFFVEELQKSVNAPIIDLPREVIKSLQQEKVNLVTVLGTPTTVKKGLYCTPALSFCNPNDEELQILSAIIMDFNRGIGRELQIEKAKALARKYRSHGSEKIVLACTELALMLQGMDLPYIDPMDILINKVVAQMIES